MPEIVDRANRDTHVRYADYFVARATELEQGDRFRTLRRPDVPHAVQRVTRVGDRVEVRVSGTELVDLHRLEDVLIRY